VTNEKAMTEMKRENRIKVELSLCLTKYHTMKTYGDVKV
jgi:hypothetical protein